MINGNQYNPYVSSKKDRRKIFQLWDRFNSNLLAEENISTPYESMIVKEWNRCRNLNVNVSMNRGVLLSANVYESIRVNQRELLEKALPVLKNVSHFLTGVPIILILADSQGNILQILGDKKVRKEAVDFNIVEGSAWREELAGNNGLGTAIHRKTPVHVFAAEHFCEGWHTWTCAATPILNPFTDEVIGVVDFTTLEKDYREEALSLSFSLASQIATELKMELEIERIQLINKYIEHSSRYAADEIVVVDRSGNIVRCNDKVKEMFPNSKLDEQLLHKNNLNFEQETVTLDEKGKTIGNVYTIRRKRPALLKGLSSPLTARVFGDFITLNPCMIKTLENINKISSTDVSVLLVGETGTGKELAARHIHEQSQRKNGPFVAVNCGAINGELFSSKFFGYEKGAFTGADPQGRKGFFEIAHRGTLFLDEMGELPLEIQASLLRVLETKQFRRLGSEREVKADFRIIAATNRQLEKEIQTGNFRSDLYFRLSVARFQILPLRERTEDIEYLAKYYVDIFCQKYAQKKKVISPEALELLKKCGWKGNCRELKNVIETMVIFSGEIISVEDIPPEVWLSFSEPDKGEHVKEEYNLRLNERQLIIAALKKYRKVFLVAKELGISRSTLYRKFEELAIEYRNYI